MWDALAQAEPITAGLVAALPSAPLRVIEIGAGSGRLTSHLSQRSDSVLAIEPALGLSRLLCQRLPAVRVVAGWAEAIPVRNGWSQLTASCGLIGPDPDVLTELERVTAPGGDIVLISPECPEWFESNGWRRLTVERKRLRLTPRGSTASSAPRILRTSWCPSTSRRSGRSLGGEPVSGVDCPLHRLGDCGERTCRERFHSGLTEYLLRGNLAQAAAARLPLFASGRSSLPVESRCRVSTAA